VNRQTTVLLSTALALIGLTLVIQGALGHGIGAWIFGALFLFAGLGRLYLSRR
jgi:hypothetical protein